ncbi:hypothetical protein [Leptolyngbya sp. FACHB-261]|uniref:hypothetical protein n=1 Tax=Leptolyngbya sp. FACHB-261 TaxID=2692806 RepID=UPI001683D5ED|nr:hypothetical protein [Leptolyngbya sp. FACHB-261]MBD2101008.1 hypothetical protein [Leptolyngbya sp. FACHB-261]
MTKRQPENVNADAYLDRLAAAVQQQTANIRNLDKKLGTVLSHIERTTEPSPLQGGILEERLEAIDKRLEAITAVDPTQSTTTGKSVRIRTTNGRSVTEVLISGNCAHRIRISQPRP